MKYSRARERQIATLDEELRAQEDFERDLEEEVRYLWKRTRVYAGHEGFGFDYWCEETQEFIDIGCDCNAWNRKELKAAIRRLRTWRNSKQFLC